MKYTCKQCGKEFEITDGEAKFYKEKGLTLPKRCKECRDKNKNEKFVKAAAAAASVQPAKATPGSKVYGSTDFMFTAGEDKKGGSKKKLPIIIAVIVVVIAAIIGKAVSSGNNDAEYETTTAEYGYSTEFDDTSEYEVSYGGETTVFEDTTAGTEEESSAEKATEEKKDSGAVNSTTVSGTASAKAVTTTRTTTVRTTTKAATTKKVTTTKAATTKKVTTTRSTTVQTVTPAYEFRNDYLLEQHYEKHGAEVGADSAEDYERMAAAVVTSSSAEHKTEAEDGDDCYYIPSTGEFVVVSTDGYIRTYYIASQAYFDRQ